MRDPFDGALFGSMPRSRRFVPKGGGQTVGYRDGAIVKEYVTAPNEGRCPAHMKYSGRRR
jgi:hypothetical protein